MEKQCKMLLYKLIKISQCYKSGLILPILQTQTLEMEEKAAERGWYSGSLLLVCALRVIQVDSLK